MNHSAARTWQMQQQQLHGHYQQHYLTNPESLFPLPSPVEGLYGVRASSFESHLSNDSQHYSNSHNNTSRRRAMTKQQHQHHQQHKQQHYPYHSAERLHYAQVNATIGDGSTAAMSKSSSSQSSQAVRRRISRACDQCNQLRTKCDGQMPCQHCVDFTLECKYARERKKRGKASRKDLQRAAEAAAKRTANGEEAGPEDEEDTSMSPMGSIMEETPPPDVAPQSVSSEGSIRRRISSARTMSTDSATYVHHQHLPALHQQTPLPSPYHNGNNNNNVGPFDHYGAFGQQTTAMEPPRDRHNQLHTLSTVAAQNMNQNFTNEFMMMSPTTHLQNNMSMNMGVSPSLTGLMGQSPENHQSPTWLSMPSPPTPLLPNGSNIKYPVLNPVLPHIYHIVSQNLACELLDLYFLNPSLSFLQPASPYVLTHVIRKKSFLHPTNPRVTSPALLAAMLWVAAQTSDAPVLSSSPSARGRICQKLLEVCINLLKPLVHIPLGMSASVSNHSGDSDNPGAGLSGLGAAGPQGREGVGAAGTLDDVLTYTHLGIVISASEFKSASLRWWHSAWNLARELRLNREVEVPSIDTDGEADSSYNVTEEEREERRRTWWFLYIVDRHLALCYNRPIALLDLECIDLYLPLDDAAWQKGEFNGAIGGYVSQDPFNGIFPSSPSYAQNNRQQFRQAGPTFTVSGPGIFGFFLPIMVILGEIVDLHHARNHPRMGASNGNTTDWDIQITEITSQLELYGCSLREWEASVFNKGSQKNENLTPETPGDGHNINSASSETSERASRAFKPKTTEEVQTKIAVSYGTHAMHVMHILLSGKWDPISMLDDNDLWISSENFISSTAHAVSASEAVSEILQYDPDLSYMPYFFGIYLLQGSFLLLLIADKLQGEASQAVVGACETIVRAHEVCVVTLNTEYQRNFRKVMRSALSQVRGRGFLPEDMEEQKLKRREVLLLYRWCGDGRGLAL